MGISLNPLSWIKEGAEALLGGAKDILDECITSGEEKLAAEARLKELLGAFVAQTQEHMAAWVNAQRDVLVAEIQGESWLQRNWRPIAMLTFLYIIVHLVVLTPIFGIPALDPSQIPADLWDVLKIGIGGYVGGRTIEKGLRTYLAAWRERNAS